MDEDLKKDLQKQIENLPDDLRKAISDTNLPVKIQEIAKKNKLLVDQAGKLMTETYLVILGAQQLKNYVSNLVKNLGLSSIQASVVAHDVNESVFKEIRETLKQISDEMTQEVKKTPENLSGLTKEEVLAGIEHPENIKNEEESISLSSLQSNNISPETYETMDTDVEILPNILPEEITPTAIIPVGSPVTNTFHQNIAPVQNINAKLADVVVVPKETIVIKEEKKLPEKTKPVSDPYREAII